MTDLGNLAASLRAAPAALEAEVRATMFRAGMNIKQGANSRAPDSVGQTVEFDIESTGEGVQVVVRTESPFGAIQEFGTPTNPGGTPFIEPAVEDELPALDKFIAEAGAKAFR